MAVETHWICDVCGERVVRSSEYGKDVNESKIKDWFNVNLNITSVANPLGKPNVHKYGYACSQKCLDKVIDWLKGLAKSGVEEEEK